MNVPQDESIIVENLSKCYQVYSRPRDRLKQSIFLGWKQFYQEFWALKEVSFSIKRGEALGVIGKNGSGKSTLLQLICGTLNPSAGNIKINGRIAALLELGAGFNPEFTGRENVFLNGAILGFTRNQMLALFPKIEQFADIGDFIDRPVKTYSSGMFVRLAFAVQACVEPDILIVDEALAVGDIFFQQKCIARIKELLTKGTSVLFVSHDMNAIGNLCDTSLWLERGEVIFHGKTKAVIEKYTAAYYGFSGSKESNINSNANKNNEQDFLLLQPIAQHGLRYGNQKAVINKFGLLNEDNQIVSAVKIGEKIKLMLEISSNQNNLMPNIGFQIKDKFGNIAIGTNTIMLQEKLTSLATEQNIQIGFNVQLMLGPGEYTISVALSDIPTTDTPDEIFDWIEQVSAFTILEPDTLEKRIGGFAYCPVDFISHDALKVG